MVLFFKGLAFKVDGRFAQFYEVDLGANLFLIAVSCVFTILYLIIGIVILNMALTTISHLDADVEYKENFAEILRMDSKGSFFF